MKTKSVLRLVRTGIKSYWKTWSRGYTLREIVRHHENGKVRERGLVTKEGKQGVWEFFSESGSMIREVKYKDDKVNGLSNTYFEDGTLETMSRFKDGLHDGKGIDYYSNGNVKQEWMYESGRFHSINVWDENGTQLLKDGIGNTVNLAYIDFMLGDLVGGADDDEMVKKYRDVDGNNEEEVKAIIREIVRPEFGNSREAKLKMKTALAYILLSDGIDLAGILDGSLLPFDYGNSARSFFIWLWHELFNNESLKLDDVGSFVAYDDFAGIFEDHRIWKEQAKLLDVDGGTPVPLEIDVKKMERSDPPNKKEVESLPVSVEIDMKIIKKNNPPTKEEVESFARMIDFTLPVGFMDFFATANGAEINGDKDCVFLWPLTEMIQRNQGYPFEKYAPEFFIFGSDGKGIAYGIERLNGTIFEMPFVGMSIGLAKEEAVLLNETFTGFLKDLK